MQPPHLQKRNVNHFVPKIRALLVHLVRQTTIEKYVLVITRCKEMVMFLALNVSDLFDTYKKVRRLA